jgi:hypothetical protein
MKQSEGPAHFAYVQRTLASINIALKLTLTTPVYRVNAVQSMHVL